LAWWRTRHEFPGGQIHLFVRNGAVFPHDLSQSLISPVLSTSLYFIVFGAAIGSRIDEIDGVSYGAFIVPGLIMLSVLTQSISNASFGIYFPKFLGSIYELHTAPVVVRRNRTRLCRRGGDQVGADHRTW
jgi:ABC-type multidrug transport system permease subunit